LTLSRSKLENIIIHVCSKNEGWRITAKVELADEVDKILEKKVLGYRSRAEFVAEAARDKLIQVKKQ